MAINMFFIPGFLISWLTFPGVIVHEAAHHLFCRLFRIPVFNVKYFQFGNPSGYVLHEPTRKPLANIFICFGPFIVNTVLGAVIAMSASIQIMQFQEQSFQTIILGWLGLSILMNAFPSIKDAQLLYGSVIEAKSVNVFVKIIAWPLVGLIYLGAIGSIVWLDAIYGIAVAAFLPKLLMSFFIL